MAEYSCVKFPMRVPSEYFRLEPTIDERKKVNYSRRLLRKKYIVHCAMEKRQTEVAYIHNMPEKLNECLFSNLLYHASSMKVFITTKTTC